MSVNKTVISTNIYINVLLNIENCSTIIITPEFDFVYLLGEKERAILTSRQ